METRTCKQCGETKPIEQFSKNAYGYTSYCKECNRKNRSNARISSCKHKEETKELSEQLARAHQMRLQDFEQRQLMEELKRRGYEFTMTYTVTKTITSDSINL